MSTKNLIILLTAVTAIIHLVLGLVSDPVNVLFILNGIGYGVLLWALLWTPGFLSGYKSFIQYAFIGFTLLTVVLYFVFQGGSAFASPIGLATKLVEIVLIFMLFRNRDG